MNKIEKNSLKTRREFYIHRIVRNGKFYDEETEIIEEAPKQTILHDYDTVGGKKPVSYADTFGYRKDTKRYDAFRTTKPIIQEEPRESVVLEEPLIDEEIGYTDQGVVLEEETNQNDFDYEVESYEEEINDEAQSYKDTTAYYSEPLQREDIQRKEFFSQFINQTMTPTVKKEEPVYFEEEPLIEEVEVVKPVVKPVVQVQTPKRRKTKYVAPSYSLLTRADKSNADNEEIAKQQAAIINKILKDAGIKAEVARYIFGPTVTQFLISIADGENVKDIRKVESNLLMYLEVSGIRIQTPIPGKPFAGIEVPKKVENRRNVFLGDMLISNDFKNLDYQVPVAVGEDNYGNYVYIDLTEMPHGLIAGTTKSGKSVCLNAFLLSLIYRFTPEELRMVLIDPKRIELGIYEGIPHLAMPVVTDEEDFQSALGWVYDEMERRYKEFETYGERNITDYNEVRVQNGEPKMPYIIVMMDEFSDWFADAESAVEMYMQKLAQKARAAGINILLATQRPSKDVIKGTIKANFDTRIAFRVTSFEDSKVILGNSGAEKLEGRGDVLIRYSGRPEQRLQGAFVPNKDIKEITRFLKENNTCEYMVTKEEIHQSTLSRQTTNPQSAARQTGRMDERFEEVAYFIVRNKNASANQITQIFSMGFNRVNDIIVALEAMKVVSPAVKGKQREVLIDEFEFTRLLESEE